MKFIKNKTLLFWGECIIITVFTYAMLAGLYGILTLNALNAFDPIGQGIGQIRMTDIAFSRFRAVDPEPDQNITIVNIGKISRGEIGNQIRSISQFNPKIIALDIIFSCEVKDSVNCPEAYDVLGNMNFYSAIVGAENKGIKVVMAEKLHQSKALLAKYDDIDEYDSIEHTDELLLGNSYEGFVNLPTDATHQEDLKECREINPAISVNGKQELAFSVMIANLFDSVKTKKFLARGNKTEVINYRGNTPDPWGASTYSGRYQFLDVEDALDTNRFARELVEGKIVLLGFHGENAYDKSWEDKFFTPLNKEYAGRGRPDMYGVVVHANAISMILKEDYIDLIPDWLSVLFSFIILIITSALFLKIEINLPMWYDLISLGIQLVLFVLLSALMLIVFSYYNLELDLSLTLGAVALSGTAFELYFGGVRRLYEYLKEKFGHPTAENP